MAGCSARDDAGAEPYRTAVLPLLEGRFALNALLDVPHVTPRIRQGTLRLKVRQDTVPTSLTGEFLPDETVSPPEPVILHGRSILVGCVGRVVCLDAGPVQYRIEGVSLRGFWGHWVYPNVGNIVPMDRLGHEYTARGVYCAKRAP